MQLSKNQPHFWTVLFLLVSNLLLWENSVSASMYDNETYDDELSLEDLFDHALNLSQDLFEFSTETREIFLQDLEFAPGGWFPDGALISCRTTTVAVMEPEEIPGLLLLKGILGMLEPWKDPLHHIGNELGDVNQPSATVISRAKTLEEKVKELLEGVRSILTKVRPGFKELEKYPTWKGMASLQSDDEERRLFATYNLFQCLSGNAYKVNSYLKTLKCQMVYDTNC